MQRIGATNITKNNQRRSYAIERRHSYAYRPDHLYAENARHNARRPYANDRRCAYTNDTRPFPSNDTPRSYDNTIDNLPESTTNHPETTQQLPETETIIHKDILPETSQYTRTPIILYPEHRHHEPRVEIYQMTHTTVDDTHQEKQQEQNPQSQIEIEFQNQISIKENKSYVSSLLNNGFFDFIRQKSPEKQEPPINTKHQNSLIDKKDNEHTIINEIANDAALNIVKQKRGKRTKPCRIAIQILQQDTKNDRIKYFMRWEDPKVQRSWSWAEDIADHLKKTFYETHTPDGRELAPWEKPNICLFGSYLTAN